MSVENNSLTSHKNSNSHKSGSVGSQSKKSLTVSQQSFSSENESVEDVETNPLTGTLQFQYPFQFTSRSANSVPYFYLCTLRY